MNKEEIINDFIEFRNKFRNNSGSGSYGTSDIGVVELYKIYLQQKDTEK